ncbi:PREDICTED: X-ray repair cross-complementing protein 5-like [Amphimedon queenslandica]|uniref:SAP domain-containing protein n=2 Tax=Amphimedon queenslandica TaxID=400682 RepID=A0AAN0ISP3_AMPQE|nr:PREDICTED: X-ray repair cross-complementing protein 5-like [Amphimedon queenslandica]|eukprot:XP_011408577.1 PREDICTED: X-ray repair cross-complementing protein 5-like [Amphimedon queenslandica]
MGFRPKSKMKMHHYIKPANFIYPDETTVSGSTKLFSVLLRRCISREVVAVCKYIPRNNSPPIFVALVPQEEELDDSSIQISPPGFHVIFLPFSEDIRSLDLPDEMPKASHEQIDKAKEIIKKLSFNFQSESFENPVIQKHYRVLEALALEHEEEEEITDLTVPDAAQINKRAGKAIDEFMKAVFPDGFDPEAKITKRKASASTAAAGGAKKAKTDEPVDVESIAKNGTLGKLTIPVLKEYLKSVGKKAAGKKQDLIDAINEHLGL